MKLTIEMENKPGSLIKFLEKLPRNARITHISSYPQDNAKSGFNITLDRKIEFFNLGEFKIKEVDRFPHMMNQDI